MGRQEKIAVIRPNPIASAFNHLFPNPIMPDFLKALNEGLQRLTPDEAIEWLAPVRRALMDLRSGEIESIRGYPVTRIDENDPWERIDWCIAGFRCMIARVFPLLSMAPLLLVEKRLADGVILEEHHIDECLKLLQTIEVLLPGVPYRVLKEAKTTEEIDIELCALGLKKSA